jgi:hypothetical protein
MEYIFQILNLETFLEKTCAEKICVKPWFFTITKTDKICHFATFLRQRGPRHEVSLGEFSHLRLAHLSWSHFYPLHYVRLSLILGASSIFCEHIASKLSFGLDLTLGACFIKGSETDKFVRGTNGAALTHTQGDANAVCVSAVAFATALSPARLQMDS